MPRIALSALAALVAIAGLARLQQAAAQKDDPLAGLGWLLRPKRPMRSWSLPPLVGPLPANPPLVGPLPANSPPERSAPPAQGSGAVDVSGGNCPDPLSILNLTNVYRTRHRAPPLSWSTSLAASSATYADKLATQCSLVHADSRSFGENLMMESSYPSPDATCTVATSAWYSEVAYYNFKAPQPFADNWPKAIGHFTQLVWVGTTSMGCGVSVKPRKLPIGGDRTLDGGCKIVVCRYQPPGNVANDISFLQNVLPNITAAVQ